MKYKPKMSLKTNREDLILLKMPNISLYIPEYKPPIEHTKVITIKKEEKSDSVELF